MTQDAVLITGASSGIGEASAELLARSGFAVLAGVRTDADAARIGAIHKNISPLHLDVTEQSSIAAAARSAGELSIPLRGIVNSAGIAVGGPTEFLPIDQWRKQFEVNLFGAIAVTQAVLPLLRAHRGRAVFVGSVSGRLGVPFHGPYSASKFALRAMTDSLRLELAPAGVRVILIEPTSVKTPIWRKGRESLERLREVLDSRAAAHYGKQLEAVFEGTTQQERIGMPVERVTRAVLHALTAKRPRTNYLIGSRMAAILAFLPATVRDRLIFGS